MKRTWNGWTQTVSRQRRPPTRVTINGIQWQAIEQHTQVCDRLQDMHNKNQEATALVSEWTLPIVDAIYLRKAHGVNIYNPNEDEAKWISAWVWKNRPHLVGERFRPRRRLNLPAQIIKELK